MHALRWSIKASPLAVSLLLAASWAVGAQTVTVDLEQATIQDVARALEEQTGFKLTFVGNRKRPEEEIRIPVFKVEGRPVKEVLRAACEQTGYRYRRVQEELFWLEQGSFEESPCRTQAAGYVVAVERLSATGESKGLDFSRGAASPSSAPQRLDVSLAVEAPTDEAAQLIYGFKDWRLADNTGRQVGIPAAWEQWMQIQSQRLQFFPAPDRAEVQVSFDPPAPGATSIASLRGTLVLYQQAQLLEFRFDDPSAKGVTKQEGGLEVTFQGARWTSGGCTVNLSNKVLGAVPEPEPHEWGQATVTVIGKDGRAFRNRTQLFPNSPTAYGVNYPEDFEPAAVLFQVVRRRYPARELPFVIENIPLP